MGKFAKQQKNIILRLIHEVAETAFLYSVHPGKDFTRSRNLDMTSDSLASLCGLPLEEAQALRNEMS